MGSKRHKLNSGKRQGRVVSLLTVSQSRTERHVEEAGVGIRKLGGAKSLAES